MGAERVAATAAGAFVGTRCLPGMQLTGSQAQELCRGTACPGDCAFWASGRTPTTTRQTARHTALFVGDSMARQLYVSTIAWLRGVAHNAATVDFGFQGTTLYLADSSGGEDAVVPLLVPLRCALARLDAAAAKESSECVAARERALDLTPQLYNSSGKPIITPLIYEMAVSQRRASGPATKRWKCVATRASQSRQRCSNSVSSAASPSSESSSSSTRTLAAAGSADEPHRPQPSQFAA